MFDEFVGTINFFYAAISLPGRATERVASVGCAQDPAAQVRDFTYGRTPKFNQTAVRIVLWLHKSVVAVANTKDLPAQAARRINRAVNDGIQAGRVTASSVLIATRLTAFVISYCLTDPALLGCWQTPVASRVAA